MVDGARKMSSWVLSVFSDRSKETMVKLYTSMVRNKLEYCSPLWNPTKVADIVNIEGVQRTFTNKITEVQHLSYHERLRELKLMSLQRRRERYIILVMWKILHKQTPNDLDVKFNHNERRGICAKIPVLHKSARPKFQTMYNASSAVMGPKLWNTVPKSINTKQTFQSFKSALTAYLLRIPDHPPIIGLSSLNSLLDLHPTSIGGGTPVL